VLPYLGQGEHGGELKPHASHTLSHDHQFMSHLVILFPKFFRVTIFVNDFSQFRVFFFQYEQLLIYILCATFSFQVKNLL
jgi:hypothetical protein